MQTRACEQCGTPFSVPYPSTRKRFCSIGCQVVAVPRPNHTGRRRVEYVTLQCPCGREFELPPNQARARKFCSPQCGKKFQAKRPSKLRESYVREPQKNRSGGRYTNNIDRTARDGYVWTYLPPEDRPAGWNHIRYPKHRQVMREVLGRDLLPGENVHHINGNKGDNRPENLELWITHQPKGGRASDLLNWARQIVALYEGSPVDD